MTHIVISEVTARIRERSVARRQAFLARIQRQAEQGKTRAALACGNLAHALAACSSDEKGRILDMTRTSSRPRWPNSATAPRWRVAYRPCATA